MFNVFTRTWWTPDKTWPGGLRPHAGRRTYIARGVSEQRARELCDEYNSTHKPGRLSRKAELEEA